MVQLRRSTPWFKAAALSAAIAAWSTAARPADAAFPSHPILLVVPFGAGGPPDTVARVVANGMSKALGRTVVVENRAGASGVIAARSVMHAEPDGYTLLAVDVSFAVTPFVVTGQSFDPRTDFKPIGQSATSQMALMASRSLNTPTLAAFIDLIKAKGEAVKIGHAGVGTTPFLAAVAFDNAAQVKPLLVPYRAITEATINLLGGQISGVFSALSNAVANQGSVDVLAVTGAARAAALPDVPTFAEKGLPIAGFDAGSWYGVVAPAATPDSVVATLNGALAKALADPEAKTALAAAGVALHGGASGEFRELIAAQYSAWGALLPAAGVARE